MASRAKALRLAIKPSQAKLPSLKFNPVRLCPKSARRLRIRVSVKNPQKVRKKPKQAFGRTVCRQPCSYRQIRQQDQKTDVLIHEGPGQIVSPEE